MLQKGRKLLANDWRKLPQVVPATFTKTFCTSPLTSCKATGNEEGTQRSRYSHQTETHFGFETVSEAQKAKKVKSVFENVADSYDLMNDCMSAGIHRVWKDVFVSRINPGCKTKMIDVAGGTGDIAFRFLKYQNATEVSKISKPVQQSVNSPSNDGEISSRSVLVADINPRMLEVGQKRSLTSLTPDEQKRIDWLEADAENMHTLPDNHFDVYTIAFGIRNCVHIENVLQEAYRILKPGGRFMCLEFSQVPNSFLRRIYDEYSFQVIPAMGQVIAGDYNSYKYLVESIRKFPAQEDFKALINDAGFRFVNYENLTFGVAAIHVGYKI